MAIKFDTSGTKTENVTIKLNNKEVKATQYKKDGKLFYEIKDGNNPTYQIIDLDGDGTFDQITSFSYKNKKLSSKTVLENLDDTGKDDRKTVYTYDSTGKKITGKTVDLNNNGKVDEKYTYKNGVLQTKKVDGNQDGTLSQTYKLISSGKKGDGTYKKVDTDGDGKADTTYYYDKNKKLVKKVVDKAGTNNDSTITYTRDKDGNVTGKKVNKAGENNDSTITYTRDKDGKVTEKKVDKAGENNDYKVTYTRDNKGNITGKKVDYTSDKKTDYSITYDKKDANGNVTKETVKKGNETYTVEYTRDVFGKVTQKKINKDGTKNDTTTKLERDDFGRITKKTVLGSDGKTEKYHTEYKYNKDGSIEETKTYPGKKSIKLTTDAEGKKTYKYYNAKGKEITKAEWKKIK